ncbi:Phosphoadenosine phosphosulfate reductase thioredoxin [Auriculariales sp. MPI-PUGE-AT-0066]|nr:Phosphoadenosine phosphosulfate reductase thioredoxin [Auriculariales sp. MPI-PUGE-AT-0066]
MSLNVARLPAVVTSGDDLVEVNDYLRTQDPQDVLRWALDNLPNLYQTTAFGLTGLAAIDMLSKVTDAPPPLIFLDTLYHFPETLKLVQDVRDRYNLPIHVYKPFFCETADDFEGMHGSKLWETDEDSYDYLVKVEPAQRAYAELNVKSVITGRRGTQGGARNGLQPLEFDESANMLKLNPFFAWTFAQVHAYIQQNNVPRNSLLDQGYKSVGDWHSTAKSGDGEAGERAGRWQGKAKTECGLHKDFTHMKLKAKKTVREEELRLRDEARDAEPALESLTPVPVIASLA